MRVSKHMQSTGSVSLVVVLILGVLALSPGLRADTSDIQISIREGQVQIGTDVMKPFYVQWYTPGQDWMNWTDSSVPSGDLPCVWMRAIFETDDPMQWDVPADVKSIYYPTALPSSEGDGSWVSVGQVNEDGSLSALPPPVDDSMTTEVAGGDLPATARNNQAMATPDPGNTTIYWLNTTDARFALWILATNGTRKASNVSNATAPGGWQVVGIGDIDRDGVSDIMWFRPSDGAMAYWLMEADGYRKASGNMGATAPGGWTVVGTGDIDADGTTDMMWFRPTDGAMSYWLLNTNGTRKAAGGMGATAPGGWTVVGTGDIDLDGTADMMWFRPSDGAMAYWFLNPDGTRKAAGNMGATAPGGWTVVGTGDINGDGVTDMMWFRPSDGAMSYWLLNANGTRKAAGSMGATAPGGWEVSGTGSF